MFACARLLSQGQSLSQKGLKGHYVLIHKYGGLKKNAEKPMWSFCQGVQL